MSFAGMIGVFVCDNCWNRRELKEFRLVSEMTTDELLESDDDKLEKIGTEFDKILDLVNRRCWCGECIAEVKVKQARQNNEPDPFPVFEKTLTEKQKETVRELEENLIRNFKFQKSIYWKSQGQDLPAIFILPGAYTYPLQIKIYYVFSETEQNGIVRFVENFLRQTELNQAKILFYEAENWVTEKKQFNALVSYRGEEKILREVYLNC